MGTDRRVVYWDSCVFIAWLNKESDKGVELLNALESCVAEIVKDDAILITSAITLPEVLSSLFSNETCEERFLSFLDRENVEVVPVDQAVAKEARAIRDFYQALNKQDGKSKKLLTPDAVHLATAIRYEVAELQTFDGLNQSGSSLKLLSLNGSVANKPLKICTPSGIHAVIPGTSSTFRH